MTALLVYGLPLLAAVAYYLYRRKRIEAAHARDLRAAHAAGLTEPPSLHPVIDPVRCIGSSGCVRACPEQALGIVDGKAVLTQPAACIGHGACHAACPVGAIELVFGTERRGMDIPDVKPNFETNVGGIFIAGELGGMGLIRKAAEQGKQAIASIARLPPTAAPLDVVIVGAGPAGIAAGLGAIAHRLRYRLIEQEDGLGGTVYHYPRNKIAMTAPVDLPIVGRVRMTEVSKEALLEFWQKVVRDSGLDIRFGERMEALEPCTDGFRLRTSNGEYVTRAVLLAIGRRGTPRTLGVPGEELPKVVYRLVEAEQYRGRRVLVVGGGDSAIEAALACAAQPGSRVSLSYRGEAFSRAKARNRAALEEAQRAGRLDVLLGSNVRSIAPDCVVLSHQGGELRLENDAVIVSAGGVLPTDLLKRIGIRFETKYGTA